MKDLHDFQTKKKLHSGFSQTFLIIFARSSKECQTGIASRPCTNFALGFTYARTRECSVVNLCEITSSCRSHGSEEEKKESCFRVSSRALEASLTNVRRGIRFGVHAWDCLKVIT